MITRTCIIVTACSGFLIILQTLLPKALALKKTSNVDEFMVEDQRTHTRQNYVVQRALDDEVFDNIGVAYTEPDGGSDELPALIVDYANMIRNDVILLDNSVETKTRKRGNIKVKKYNQAIPDPPCSCEYSKEPIDFGEDCYPRYIETRICSNGLCPPSFDCRNISYNITVLRRKASDEEKSPLELPNDLRRRWIALKKSVTIGCVCSRDYIKQN